MIIGRLSLCVGALLAVSPAAFADGPVRTACKAEFEKFCKVVPDGGGRVRACLDAHSAEASDACRDALGAHGPRKDPAPSPPADVEKK